MVALALWLHYDRTCSLDEICEQLHSSRSTLFRYVRQARPAEKDAY
jgi:DNA-binding transcriptional regulator LsrR (DeoR family)